MVGAYMTALGIGLVPMGLAMIGHQYGSGQFVFERYWTAFTFLALGVWMCRRGGKSWLVPGELDAARRRKLLEDYNRRRAS